MPRRLISGLVDRLRIIGPVIALGLASFFTGSALAGTVYVGTELPRKTMVAGDGRIHKVRVYVDNSENEPVGISGTNWGVQVNPLRFGNVSVSVPDNPSLTEGDLWKDILLMNNVIDTTPDEMGYLGPNARGPPHFGQPDAHGRGLLKKFHLLLNQIFLRLEALAQVTGLFMTKR